jgi:hypothetical protein
MSINASLPLATDLVSAIDDYIREDREQINELWAAITAANCTETDHEMGAGEFALEIGTDLEDVIIEAVNLTATVAVDLIQITSGSGGMIKVIKAGDDNVTVKHNASYIDLTGNADLTLTSGMVLGLINIGGDPDSSVNGVWYELFRSSGSGGASMLSTSINMSVGQTNLVGDSDINAENSEVILLTADAAVNLTTMENCVAGAFKIIVAMDDNITLVQNTGSTTGGTFYLNSPAGVDLEMETRDVIALINVGGDGVTADGYWLELWRKLQV